MNWIKYIDCMDPNEGLPSLPDKSIDLCLTDPPYNQDWRAQGTKINRQNYEDKQNPQDYFNWSKKWFREIKRICKNIIFTPGYRNHSMWYKIDNFDYIIHYNLKAQGGSRVAYLRKFEPILCFFSSPIINRFKFGVLKFHYSFKEYKKIWELKLSHSCSKLQTLWEDILKQINPLSVIDPFMGSGTTAEACIRLGIPYCGYEIMPEYKVDIDKRIERAHRSKEAGQKKLEAWIQ